MVIVQPNQLGARAGLYVLGGFAGFCGFLLCIGLGLVIPKWSDAAIFSVIALMVCAIGPLVLVTRRHLASIQRVIALSGSYGIGLAIIPLVVGAAWGLSYGFPGILWVLSIPPLCVGVGAAAWVMLQHTRWAVVLHDGIVCLDCGYALTGLTSQTCPECGRPFGDHA